MFERNRNHTESEGDEGGGFHSNGKERLKEKKSLLTVCWLCEILK